MNHLDRRKLVIAIAANEIGDGRVSEYWRDVLGPSWRGPYPKHWCGAFALWCLRQTGLARDVSWRVAMKKNDPSGFLLVEHAAGKMPRTKTPMAGDIAYFDAPYQHHAIVESATPTQLVTIDGNQGSLNGTPVRRVHRKMPGGATFHSISLFLTAAELEGEASVIEPADSRTPTDPAPPPSTRDIFPTLRRGDTGEGVRELQRRLGIAADGSFGPKTEAAVRDLQGLHALKVDGVAGPKTWAVLA